MLERKQKLRTENRPRKEMDLEAETLSMESKHQTTEETNCPVQVKTIQTYSNDERQEPELHRLVVPDVRNLPLSPPSSVESNFVSYFAPDFVKPGHDQFIYRHANGLCVVGLAKAHVCFKDEGGILTVDFNIGKADRSGNKVTGKRKKNAQFFESNTALCKVSTKENSYIVRCCVRGSLLEVNERLLHRPELLNSSAEREGYIGIIMPRAADWLKIKDSLVSSEDYKKLRKIH